MFSHQGHVRATRGESPSPNRISSAVKGRWYPYVDGVIECRRVQTAGVICGQSFGAGASSTSRLGSIWDVIDSQVDERVIIGSITTTVVDKLHNG